MNTSVKEIIGTTLPNAVLYEGPSVAYKIIKEFSRRMEVEVMGMNDNRGWLFIRGEDFAGWIYKNYVEI